ncbi:MAG: hypothetical protein WBQ52_11715 [Terracidiphilus sp.]
MKGAEFMPLTQMLVLSGVVLLGASTICRGSAARGTGAQVTHAAGSSLTWVSYQDPLEQAFTVEVPRGWTTRGGLIRMGYSDERPMVDLTSPDGQINVRIGDVSIPVYTPPNQYHNREGEVYDLGAQAQLIVARYRTGPEFAVLYSHVRFYQDCHDPTPDTANVGFTVPDYIPQEGTPEQTSTGQIAYLCDGGKRVAYAYVRTVSNGGIWSVPTLGSYLSPTGRVALARSVLEHCARTFKLNPAWIEKQKQLDAYALQYQRQRQQQRMAEMAEQQRQFEAKMQAMRDQVSSFEHRQQSFANQQQGFLNILNGVTPTIDPFTGEAKDVWTGTKSNYWTNGVGDVVNSTNAPAAGWRQMQVTGP